jgi:hypothetical protein
MDTTQQDQETPVTPDLDEAGSPTDYAAALSARERHRLATRPNIDALADAVVKGEDGRLVFLARPGDKLIVERFATVLAGRPWLDTKTYTVYTIDGANGNLVLIDDELQRQAMSNYVTGTAYGYRFKLPTPHTPALTSKRKRGRPRKNPVVAAPVAPTPASGEAPVKRKRGRPPGVKNRPAAVRAAEAEAKAAVRAAKRAAKRTGK